MLLLLLTPETSGTVAVDVPGVTSRGAPLNAARVIGPRFDRIPNRQTSQRVLTLDDPDELWLLLGPEDL